MAIDVLADLRPLPTAVSSGTGSSVDAKLLVPASEAKVLVLGPSGRPFAVPTSRDGEQVRAPGGSSGVWLTQVLATVAGGPRPVAEALVHADVDPAPEYSALPAPGGSRRLARPNLPRRSFP